MPQGLRERILAKVDAAQCRGYVIEQGELYDGIGRVAVAFCDAVREPIAALSVIVPSTLLTEDRTTRIARKLLESVAALEASLGIEPKTDGKC